MFSSGLKMLVICKNFMQSYYICSARELARMVGIRKAPVLHHFSETVSGAATIRCFNQGEKFFRKSLALIDDYSRITFHNSATIEWLCVRINFLFNLVFFVMLVILVSMPRNTIDPSKRSHEKIVSYLTAIIRSAVLHCIPAYSFW